MMSAFALVTSIALAVLLAAHFSTGQEFIPPVVQFHALDPKGFRFAIPAHTGLEDFEFHGVLTSANGNVELAKYDVRPTLSKDGQWLVHFDENVQVTPGDTITYWLYFSHNLLGYRYDDHSHMISNLLPPSTSFTVEGSLSIDCLPTPTRSSTGRACKGQLLFEDNFRTAIVDPKKWRKEKRLSNSKRENGFMSIQPKTISIVDGTLIITPMLQKDVDPAPLTTETLSLSVGCTAPDLVSCEISEKSTSTVPRVVTGKITTKTSFSFQYGRIVIRAKLPIGDWIYPELNLESADMEYGDDGYSSGVIRIAFARGNIKYTVDDLKYDNTVLSGGVLLDQLEPCRSQGRIAKIARPDPWGYDFHDYEVVWKEDSITLRVDDTEYGVIKAPPDGFVKHNANCKEMVSPRWKPGTFAPFDQKFFISLGVGVGGVSDFPDSNSKPWKNFGAKSKAQFAEAVNQWIPTWGENKSLIIDSVRVWAL